MGLKRKGHKGNICHLFSELFSNEKQNQCLTEDFKDWMVPLNQISTHQVDYLMEAFSSEEIKEVMFNMKPIKSPGPDGIPAVFLQKNWGVIGYDIVLKLQKIS